MLSSFAHTDMVDSSWQLEAHCNMVCNGSIGVMVMLEWATYLRVAGIEVHSTQSFLWVCIEVCISLHTTHLDIAGNKSNGKHSCPDMLCSMGISIAAIT